MQIISEVVNEVSDNDLIEGMIEDATDAVEDAVNQYNNQLTLKATDNMKTYIGDKEINVEIPLNAIEDLGGGKMLVKTKEVVDMEIAKKVDFIIDVLVGGD